jgi:2,4-dienoyl-CoA reductase-like NADH-dependent reductase (Old Yellow Enzyme family)/thioredoxin reductase
MALYDKLFQPLQVGRITIPNRVVRSPHGTGLVGEDLVAYHEARARGGVGMSTLEASGVHPSAPIGVPVHSDSCIPIYEKLVSRVAPHGMKLFQQIYHGGAGYPEAIDMPEHWSASAIPNPLAGVMPLEMTQTMIDDVVAGFASAARRCRDGGLDGVDIHASSGYLIHEFLSPATNHRGDGYGGSFENRLRFLLEVIAAVRDEVGDSDFAVGVRLPNEDYIPGGLTAADNARIAGAIDPLVDYISLHMGAYWRFHKLIGLMDEPLGLEMPANAEITPHISKPTMVVGRIMTLDHASHLVESGAADMVSMVRALIADPELVNKARRREEHRIRPCIGSNMGCVGGLMGKGRMGCVVNSSAGKEAVLSFEPQDKTARPKHILVVGGGPAGLEFARTAALRGHRVELHEATKQLGGQVSMAAQAPHRADLGAITSWLADELESLAVDVRLNSLVDAALVAEIAPDDIVIATGTNPRSDGFQVATPASPIPGFDLPHVHTAWDLFGRGRPVAIKGPALVFDDTGTFEAISVAEQLLQAGASVTLVSRLDALGASVPYPPVTVGAARERLMSADFEFIGGHYLREITAESVHIGVLFTERDRAIPARTVILVSHNAPNRDLAAELEAQGLPVHLVGEVRGRSGVLPAIHGAAELGRRI